MKKIFISVISRNTAYWHMFNHFQMAANKIGKEMGIMCQLAPHIGDSLVSRARNTSLQSFRESEADWLFTLDDDIQLPEDALTKLVNADRDLVGGIYRLKNDEPKRNPYAIRFLNEDMDIKNDTLNEVKYLSTGCMLYKRTFVEKLVEQYPDLWYYENMTGRTIPALYMPYIYQDEYLSEDWAFCQRARDRGHKIWLHSGVQCGHWGLKNYAMADLAEDEKDVS